MSIKTVSELSGHSDRVWCVAWNPQGSMLASCGGDKTIRLWGKNGDSWSCKTILTEGHQRTIRSVAWSTCGNYLASTSFDATTCIWDKRSGQFECVATLEGHENEVKCAAWSQSGQYLATCSRDKSVWIWEVGEDDEYECASVMASHSQDVKKVLWHPHKNELVSASYDNTIKFYKEDFDDWCCFCTLTSHESTVWSLSFNKTGNKLASCSDDKKIKIWKEYPPGNAEGIPTTTGDCTWKCVCTLSGYHKRAIYDIDWCHQTGWLATAGGDDSILIFQEDDDTDPNAPTFNVMYMAENVHSQDVNSVSWNPKVPGLLASGSDDCIVKIWQVSGS